SQGPVEGQLRSVGYVKFSHHLADMNFHSSLTHTKVARNHLVRLSQADVRKNLALAHGQVCGPTSQIVSGMCRARTVCPVPVVSGFGFGAIRRAILRLF